MSTIDQIALDTVQAIAGIDPDKLKGGKGQAMAQAQCLVIDAMKQAGAPDMRPIALKKLSQMGATVHGVLAKNEAGAWVAVSEFGRVMWLDNFEGQASSAHQELLEIHRITAHVAGVTELTGDETLTVSRVKQMAMMINEQATSAQPEQPSAGVVPEAKEIIDRVVEGLENGFVRCERCGDQEDTATLDCMIDLKRLQSLLTAAPTAQAVQGGGVPIAFMYADEWGRTKIVRGKETAEHWCPPGETVTPLYTHPHNGEQGGEWRHWYALSYRGTDLESGHHADAVTYIGFPDNALTLPRILQGKTDAGVSETAVLISATYCGYMTKTAFTGQPTKSKE